MTGQAEQLLEEGAPAQAAPAEHLDSGQTTMAEPRDEFAARISELLKPDWPSPPADETEKEEAPAQGEQTEGEELQPAAEDPAPEGDEEQEVQGWPDSARQRVDRLTAKNGKLKEQLESVQGELEVARSEAATKGDILKAPPIPPALPYGELKTEEELSEKLGSAQRLYNEVKSLRQLLRTDPKRVEAYYRSNEVILKDADGNEDFSRQRIQDHLDTLEEHARGEADKIARRRAWNAEAARAERDCMAYIPWMRNPKSPEYKLAQEALKVRPEVLNFPDWKLIVAAHVMGMQRINEMIALVKAKGERPAPPKAGSRPGHVPGAAPPGAAQSEIRKTLLNGSPDKVQAAISSMLSLPAVPAGGRLPGPRRV